jgi:hypothetical protein
MLQYLAVKNIQEVNENVEASEIDDIKFEDFPPVD